MIQIISASLKICSLRNFQHTEDMLQQFQNSYCNVSPFKLEEYGRNFKTKFNVGKKSVAMEHFCIQLHVRINLKRIMFDNLKVLLQTLWLNPATGLPHEFIIYYNTISNTFDLFDEVSEMLENSD